MGPAELVVNQEVDLEVVLERDSTLIMLGLLEEVEDTLEVVEEDKTLETEVEVETI